MDPLVIGIVLVAGYLLLSGQSQTAASISAQNNSTNALAQSIQKLLSGLGNSQNQQKSSGGGGGGGGSCKAPGLSPSQPSAPYYSGNAAASALENGQVLPLTPLPSSAFTSLDPSASDPDPYLTEATSCIDSAALPLGTPPSGALCEFEPLPAPESCNAALFCDNNPDNCQPSATSAALEGCDGGGCSGGSCFWCCG